MEFQQVSIVFISDDPKRTEYLVGLLNAPISKILDCSFKEAYETILLKEKPDIVILDVISFPDFSYTQLENTRLLPKYTHVPFLFLIPSDEKILLQIYKYEYNRILIEPVDRYLLVNEIKNSIHFSNLEQQLNLYKDIVDSEKRLITHMDELLEIDQLNKYLSRHGLFKYVKNKFISRLELVLAAEKAIFITYSLRKKILYIKFHFHTKENGVKELEMPLKGSKLQVIYSKNVAEIYEKNENDYSIAKEFEKIIGFPVSGFLTVPLLLFHKPIGAFILINKLYRTTFSENDLAFAAIASQKMIYQLEKIEIKKKSEKIFADLINETQKEDSHLLEQVLAEIDFGLIIFDSDMNLYFRNRASSELLDKKNKSDKLNLLIGEKWYLEIEKYINENEFPVIRQEIKLSANEQEDFYIGYSIYKMDWSFESSYYILVFSEISQTKKLQAEIIRMDRMASLGVLSSGIAHEIRNPLAGIKAMAQNMEEELEKDSSHLEYIERILRQVDRLDLLLRSFFTYAKPMHPDPRPCQIPEIISEALALFPSKFRDNNIKVLQNYSDDLAYVYVDPGQIQQVLINMVLNAIQAMQNGGSITISAHNTEKKNPFADSEMRRVKKHFKKFIQLELKDDGNGIDSNVMEKIFNPFFTTKSSGTGLGLAIVYQIINEHGGSIDVESTPEKGTTFKILLPAIKDEKEIH